MLHVGWTPRAARRRQRAAAFAAFALAFALQATFAPSPVRAQDVGRPVTHDPEADVAAPVVVDGRELFRIGALLARAPADRASAIADRIAAAARDPDVDAAALRFQEEALGTAIFADGRRMMLVTDQDAAREGGTRLDVAADYRRRISGALEAYRDERRPERVLAAAGSTGAAVAVFAFALFALAYVVRLTERQLARRVAHRAKDIGSPSLRVLGARAIWTLLRGLVRAGAIVAAIAAAYGTIWYALGRFPATRDAAHRLADLVIAPVQALGWSVVDALPGLLVLVVIVIVTRYVLGLFRMLADAVGAGSVRFEGFDAEWAAPTYRIVRLFVIALAIVAAYPYIPGSHTDAFKGVSVLIGLILSLGSSSIVANVIAGYSMTFRRAFRVGDMIAVGDSLGTVTEVRLQVTHLRNARNEELVIPNSQLMQSTVTNYSKLAREHGLILHTEVGIGYETPWRQVEAMLKLAADRVDGLQKQPPPFVRHRALGDFAITYELHAYTESADDMIALKTELNRGILDVFNEYGVQIMTPNYVADTPEPKVVPRAQWHLAPAVPPKPST